MRTTLVRPDLRPFYLVLIAAGAIVAHLAAEFAAMGSDADEVLFSARHWYLGLTVLACVAVFCLGWRTLRQQSSSARDLKRMLHVGLATLPFGGVGIRFFGVTAALQLAIGMLTQIGEGCPFCGHDIAAGVAGALITVIILALATRAAASQMPAIVDALVIVLPTARPASEQHARAIERNAAALPLPIWSAPLFNRPPPPLRFAITSL
ncbi:MAG TPA: hypothetical protein VKT51_10335 [Candidatus Eremiobacteraceae bacterium]|nr:hypothetical protein [Candidatus Eremiobacteraceae bacterium]